MKYNEDGNFDNFPVSGQSFYKNPGHAEHKIKTISEDCDLHIVATGRPNG